MTPAASEERRANIAGKNYGDELIRSMSTGSRDATGGVRCQGFEPYMKDISPHMPAYELRLPKGRAPHPRAFLTSSVNAREPSPSASRPSRFQINTREHLDSASRP